MKKTLLSLLLLMITTLVVSQNYTNNDNPVGLEHNMLFNAATRYKVTQTGNAGLNIGAMFDGKFSPSYTSVAPTVSSPTVILIENLPSYHTQRGAWVGWSTRYWEAKRFKIEGFNSYAGANVWVTIADYSNTDYTGGAKFIQKAPAGTFTKLRFTFYSARGTQGRLGVSELFYLHPEGMRPYDGLFDTYWTKNGNDISYTGGNIDVTGSNKRLYLGGAGGSTFGIAYDKNYPNYGIFYTEGSPDFVSISPNGNSKNGVLNVYGNGKVGIGTTDTKGFELGVNGKIAATEVKIAKYADWADFVFAKEYKLPTLTQVENHIKEKGHLKDIPSAEEVKKDGFFLGEMDAKLLQKIEELTLYTIQQEKKIKRTKTVNKKLLSVIEKLEKRITKLENSK